MTREQGSSKLETGNQKREMQKLGRALLEQEDSPVMVRRSIISRLGSKIEFQGRDSRLMLNIEVLSEVISAEN